jgi:hypothetical protein
VKREREKKTRLANPYLKNNFVNLIQIKHNLILYLFNNLNFFLTKQINTEKWSN